MEPVLIARVPETTTRGNIARISSIGAGRNFLAHCGLPLTKHVSHSYVAQVWHLPLPSHRARKRDADRGKPFIDAVVQHTRSSLCSAFESSATPIASYPGSVIKHSVGGGVSADPWKPQWYQGFLSKVAADDASFAHQPSARMSPESCRGCAPLARPEL